MQDTAGDMKKTRGWKAKKNLRGSRRKGTKGTDQKAGGGCDWLERGRDMQREELTGQAHEGGSGMKSSIRIKTKSRRRGSGGSRR